MVDYYTTECEECKQDMDLKNSYNNDDELVEEWRCYDCKIAHNIIYKFLRMEIVKN